MVRALMERGDARGISQIVLNPFQAKDYSPWEEVLGSDAYVGRKLTLRSVSSLLSWTREHLVGFAPDILHAHLFHAALVGGMIGQKGWVRILTHHHGTFYERAGRRGAAALDAWAGRRYRRVVAVSDHTAGELSGRIGWRRMPISVIRNGWFGSPVSGVAPPGPTVVCVGNFRPEKRHDLLVQAFASVRCAVPSARLVLVGDGALKASLKRQVNSLGLTESVFFTGYQVDPWPWLAEASVLAQASKYETLGISILEGMAAGLPIVATAVGGVPELVEDGVTGLLVPEGDAHRLSDALERLLNSPKLARRMGEAGRARAQKWTDQKMASQYFDLYQSLAHGGETIGG